jgi:trans-2,3-dihydro-3-hydroxyanthranilate isomerase
MPIVITTGKEPLMNPTFHIVDVFAETKYAGNQLAVVRGAGDLPDETMRKIAAEFGFSETTFVVSDEERGGGGYDVRIFTPEYEVPFAGHPTLGTAFVIRSELLKGSAKRVVLNLEAGKIPVTSSEEDLWMEQLPPIFGGTLDSAVVARVLGLEKDDLDSRYPVQEVSTGLPAVIVPLENLDALGRCRVDRARYFELVGGREAKNVYAFCPEPHEAGNDLAARMFSDYHGVPEDPATGSAAGCLAGYLVEHRYLGGDSVDARLEQGYEIGRPSLLYLRAGRKGDEITVSVGGKVQMVARGELL